MNINYTIALFTSVLVLNACQESSVNNNTVTETKIDSATVSVTDTIIISKDSTEKIWKELTRKLEPVKIPATIDCDNISDSVQFELSAIQIKQLLPKEVVTQKDPIISAFHTLQVNNSIQGTFYCIQYPVVYDQLDDTRCEILLVLYDLKGQYLDYKILALQDYGVGYSKIKSLNEIVYLYSGEMETIETDITIYSLANPGAFEKVNEMHFSSRGSQEEYEKNKILIEKLMK